MPFTQAEIDEVWRVNCALHGTTPEELGIQAPKLGSLPTIPPSERKCLRLIERFNRLLPKAVWR